MIPHFSNEQIDEIFAYLNRHLHLFKDVDFINLVRSGDVADAVACARHHLTVLPKAACGHVMPEVDALRYGAFLTWLDRNVVSVRAA